MLIFPRACLPPEALPFARAILGRSFRSQSSPAPKVCQNLNLAALPVTLVTLPRRKVQSNILLWGNMRSSHDHEGFKLLEKWNTSRTEIHLSFSGLASKLSLSGTGIVTAFDQGGLGFAGSGFEFLLDLSEAAFENVGTHEAFRKRGLDPSQYTESAEICLGNGSKVILVGPPRPIESPAY
jgi:hypothetical protein